MSNFQDYAINSRAAEVAEWLHSVIDIHVPPLGTTPHKETPKTQTSFPTLVEDDFIKEHYIKYYKPVVVSIGPYHMGKEHVELIMDKFKKKAVWELAERGKNKASIEQVYASVEKDLLSARESYHPIKCTDDEWCLMMFLDGCFIIEFLFNDRIPSTRGRRSWLNMKKHDLDLVRRDLLLFENQFPFKVLDMLARAFNCPLDILTSRLLQMPLLDISSDPNPSFRDALQQWKPQDPIHLLQLYRDLWIRVLFGVDVEGKEEEAEEDHPAVCPPYSATELRKVGIRCRCASGRRSILRLSDIHLRSSKLSGRLFLPRLTIGESTMTLFHNLLVYEYSCNLQDRSSGILSYLSFMSMLINKEEDVKELRARGVIQLNIKVGDDQVVNFFKDITGYIEPNPQAFRHVKRQISKYLKSKQRPLKEVYAEFKQRYFSGPWSFVVFLAVVLTVSMTVVQTVFTGIQTYKKN